MAKTCVGLGKMLAHAYYLPLSYAHGTARAVVARLIITEKGGFAFSADPQPKEADQALQTAHKILLLMLGFQLDYFGPEGLAEISQTCTSDFISIWQKPVSNASDNDLTEL